MELPIIEIPETAKSILDRVISSSWERVSKTIQHDTGPEWWVTLSSELSKLKKDDPVSYEFIIDNWIILDLWSWKFLPNINSRLFSDFPIRVYIWIDLEHRKDSVYGNDSTILIKKGWDFFSILENIPDSSIPCVYMRLIDSYILNWESSRLQELLKRKMHPKWVIIRVW